MFKRVKPYIATVETSVKEVQNFTMKDLNQMHFAFLDHEDRYYSLKETKQYVDFKV